MTAHDHIVAQLRDGRTFLGTARTSAREFEFTLSFSGDELVLRAREIRQSTSGAVTRREVINRAIVWRGKEPTTGVTTFLQLADEYEIEPRAIHMNGTNGVTNGATHHAAGWPRGEG